MSVPKIRKVFPDDVDLEFLKTSFLEQLIGIYAGKNIVALVELVEMAPEILSVHVKKPRGDGVFKKAYVLPQGLGTGFYARLLSGL
jgi:hypothetical protein